MRGAELSGDFSGINFENANLKYAIIIGKADFRNAKGLQCVQVKDIKNFGEGFYSPVLNKELHLTQ
ncbi:MAG: pentapeptide repeat-containing protein [Synechocystis sp.]